MHSGNHDSSMEVSTIKMAGSNGQQLQRSISSSQLSHSTQSYHNTNKSQNTSPTSQETNNCPTTGSIRHSPDHSTASMRSHHSSPSSSDQSLNGHHSPHSTSPMSHAVVSSSTFSHNSVKQESEGNSVIMKQEHHELPPIHQAAFGVTYANYGQAVPYVTSLSDTQTVLVQAANGEYYRTPIATSAGSMMDYGYGFQTGRSQAHFQDPSDQMIMERYRQATNFPHSMNQHNGISIDLPSPDSGLGERDHSANQVQKN